MKNYVTWLILFFAHQGLALTLKGLNVDGFVFANSGAKIQTLSLDFCEDEKCAKVKTVIPCKNQGPNQWGCHSEAIPDYFRFQLKLGKKQILTAVQEVKGRLSQRLALHIQDHQVQLLDVNSNLVFRINMQDMLENVFEPGMVEQIRRVDLKTNEQKLNPHPGKSKIALKICQNDGCLSGQVDEVICTLYSKGISELSINCPRKEFARFGQLAFYGRDKNRLSAYFALNEKTSLNLTSDSILEMLP